LVRIIPVRSQRRAERARGVHRVLTGHGVHHEQALGGADRGIDVAHFGTVRLASTCRRPGGVDD